MMEYFSIRDSARVMFFSNRGSEKVGHVPGIIYFHLSYFFSWGSKGALPLYSTLSLRAGGTPARARSCASFTKVGASAWL